MSRKEGQRFLLDLLEALTGKKYPKVGIEEIHTGYIEKKIWAPGDNYSVLSQIQVFDIPVGTYVEVIIRTKEE